MQVLPRRRTVARFYLSHETMRAMHSFCIRLWYHNLDHPHRWDEALEIVNGMDVFLEDVDIPWGSLSSWRHILELAKNGSSAGTDGWRYEELKKLPDSALGDLIQLFEGVRRFVV